MMVQVFLGERRSGLVVDSHEPAWTDTATVDEGLAWLSEQAASVRAGRWRRPRATIWLSGSLARPFLLQPIPGVANREEARRVAETIGAEATGLPGPCWAWLEAGSLDAVRLAAVMPASVRDALGTPSIRAAIKIAHVRPWWGAVLNAVVRKMPDTVSLGVDDGECVTLLGGRGSRFELARSFDAVEPSQRLALLSRAVLGSRDLSGNAIWVSMTEPGQSPSEEAALNDVAFGGRLRRVE